MTRKEYLALRAIRDACDYYGTDRMLASTFRREIEFAYENETDLAAVRNLARLSLYALDRAVRKREG